MLKKIITSLSIKWTETVSLFPPGLFSMNNAPHSHTVYHRSIEPTIAPCVRVWGHRSLTLYSDAKTTFVTSCKHFDIEIRNSQNIRSSSSICSGAALHDGFCLTLMDTVYYLHLKSPEEACSQPFILIRLRSTNLGHYHYCAYN